MCQKNDIQEPWVNTNHPVRTYFGKKLVALLLVVIVVALVAGLLVGNYFSTDSKTTKLAFEDIGELATQAAYCTEVQVIDSAKTFFSTDVKIPFTKSKQVFSYDVVIKAGFDFADIDWNADDLTKTIRVTVPAARILSCELDLNSLKVYVENQSIFTPITLEQTNDGEKELKEQAQKDAIANGLFQNARENAEVILRGMFGQLYDLSQYTIEFTHTETGEETTDANNDDTATNISGEAVTEGQ